MQGNSLFRDEIVRDLLEKTRVLWALGHAVSLLSWDLETNMPPRGISARSEALSEIAVLQRKLLLRDEIVKAVESLGDRLDELNDYEKGVVRVLSRNIRIAKALPEDLVARLAKVTSEATRVWSEAKNKDDFGTFKPYLDEIVKLTKEKAERLGYEQHPYDALLDLYEEGLRTRDVDEIFASLVPETKRVLDRILADGFYPQKHEFEERNYELEKARLLVRRVLEELGWDWSRGRLDESPHPFTINLDVDDVRITTRYEGRDIRRPVYSAIHEFGHALYELQIDKRISRTPIGSGVSLGVHESQSRFWENVVGRSPWFARRLQKLIVENGVLPASDWLDFYRYVNIVRPDLIRVEADEVTYNLHIYLRFQLEKLLITNEIKTDDLPELWASESEKLLGVRPKKHSEGVLQDIHWSHGSIGYFPTYTLGNIIAAQLRDRMLEELGELDSIIENARFDAIKSWLESKIHRWGATYPPLVLLERSLGKKPRPESLVKYLEWKYLELPDKLGSA